MVCPEANWMSVKIGKVRSKKRSANEYDSWTMSLHQVTVVFNLMFGN